MRVLILTFILLRTIVGSTEARLTCSSFSTCDEAIADLRAGNSKLDGDSDGVPCESLCKSFSNSSTSSTSSYTNTISPVYTPTQYNTTPIVTVTPIPSTGSISTGAVIQSGTLLRTGSNQTVLDTTGNFDIEVNKLFTDYYNKNSNKPIKYHKSYISKLYTKYKKIKDIKQKYIQCELIRILSKTFNIKNPIK